MTFWEKITAWFKAKGGVLHCLAVVYVAGRVWFASSPAFHDVVIQLWGKFPSLLQGAIQSVIQILAIYGIGSGVKVVGQHLMAKFAKKPQAPNA